MPTSTPRSYSPDGSITWVPLTSCGICASLEVCTFISLLHFPSGSVGMSLDAPLDGMALPPLEAWSPSCKDTQLLFSFKIGNLQQCTFL